MNGVQGDKLLPRLLCQLNPGDLLQEAPLLNGKLWMVQGCNKGRWLGQHIRQEIENAT